MKTKLVNLLLKLGGKSTLMELTLAQTLEAVTRMSWKDRSRISDALIEFLSAKY